MVKRGIEIGKDRERGWDREGDKERVDRERVIEIGDRERRRDRESDKERVIEIGDRER